MYDGPELRHRRDVDVFTNSLWRTTCFTYL